MRCYLEKKNKPASQLEKHMAPTKLDEYMHATVFVQQLFVWMITEPFPPQYYRMYHYVLSQFCLSDLSPVTRII